VADDTLHKNDWLRLPEGVPLSAVGETNGAKLWIKTGHLPFAKAPQA